MADLLLRLLPFFAGLGMVVAVIALLTRPAAADSSPRPGRPADPDGQALESELQKLDQDLAALQAKSSEAPAPPPAPPAAEAPPAPPSPRPPSRRLL